MHTTTISTNNNTITNFHNINLLFANSTIYNNSKHSKNRTYTSNISIKLPSKKPEKEYALFPLYQIYYNPGQKNWGLWRCPYTHGAWEKPIFLPTLQSAINKAKILIQEEEFDDDEYIIQTTSHITYRKKLDNFNYQIIKETTYFMENPE